jgi:hypothetical protein
LASSLFYVLNIAVNEADKIFFPLLPNKKVKLQITLASEKAGYICQICFIHLDLLLGNPTQKMFHIFPGELLN